MSQAVLARGDQAGRPIPIQSSPAEQITEEATQDFLDALNTEDVSRCLPAYKQINVIRFQLVEVVYVAVVKKVIETPAEQFNLADGVSGQAFMLLTKIEVFTGFREEVMSPYGLSPRKQIALEMADGSSPA